MRLLHTHVKPWLDHFDQENHTRYTIESILNYFATNIFLQVNLMLGGYDTIEDKPRLHMLDYMGSDIECPYGAHGYGAMFTMSILDRHYNK